jgi:hypothetical protein
MDQPAQIVLLVVQNVVTDQHVLIAKLDFIWMGQHVLLVTLLVELVQVLIQISVSLVFPLFSISMEQLAELVLIVVARFVQDQQIALGASLDIFRIVLNALNA